MNNLRKSKTRSKKSRRKSRRINSRRVKSKGKKLHVKRSSKRLKSRHIKSFRRFNIDGAGINDIPEDVISIINRDISCIDQENLFLQLQSHYAITINSCPKVKFMYIVRRISESLRLLTETDRKHFLL